MIKNDALYKKKTKSDKNSIGFVNFQSFSTIQDQFSMKQTYFLIKFKELIKKLIDHFN